MVPETLEDQVAAWISLYRADQNNCPPLSLLMLVYSKRKALTLNDDHKYWLSIFSLIRGLPVFYWLSDLKRPAIHAAIAEAFPLAKNPERFYILNVSGFFGRKSHEKYRSLLKSTSSARVDEFKDFASLFRVSRIDRTIENEQEAESLSLELSQRYDISKLSRLQKLDCALYAPFT